MDLDEDSHLCIRCNKTIIGLQNYVNHRQSNCGAQESSTKAFSPNFHFLDSHTNKNMQSYEAFTFDEQEESDEDDEMEEDEEDVEISERNNKSAESEFKEYDYDFFSSLELQYQSKRDDIPPASSKKCHQRILTRKATAALMATQNDDEWIDDSSVGINKKEDEEEEEAAFKYFHNDSNESTDSEEEPAVPRNYTRGKWKPGTRIMNSYGEKWKSDIEENESSNDDNLDKSIDTHPPSTSTQGKWVPGSKVPSSSSSYKRLEFKEEKYDSFLWCKICSRSLTSRANFERHLKSNLHKKRTKKENELEGAGESLPMSNINELSAHFEQSMKEKSVVTGENTEIIEIESEILNRATTSTPIIQRRRAHDDDDVDDYDEEDDNIYCALEGAKEEGSVEKMEKKKFRSRSKITCEECDMKLSVHLFPNHLISHFHYRKMLQNPKNTFNSILNNFHKIVIHLPFQCQPCKFYFNTREQFTRHWNSIEHAETVSKLVGGKFLCSFCKFECESNGEMTAHLEHSEHQQVVTLINRVRPFVVRYISRIACKYCHQEFRFNIQLIRHLKTCDLKCQQKFPFDGYTNCNVCDKVFQSALALQKHKRTIHKISIFYCSECKMTFETALDAKRHRKTSMHKAISQRQNMRKGLLEKQKKKKNCPHCKQECLDIIELKQHIQIFHSQHKLSCGLCGMKFILSQDVSLHVRNKLCKFFNSNSLRLEEQSTKPCTTIASNETVLENADTSSSPTSNTTFSLITANSIKYTTTEACDKVQDAPTDLDMLDNNFTDILLNCNDDASNVLEKDFGTVIGEIENSEEQIVEILFSCKICEFSTNSHAEFIFHEILHQIPKDQKSSVKLQCSICKKLFRKQSLREHLRQHTQERIFRCPIEVCPMAFTRKANLKNHIRNVHSSSRETEKQQSAELFLCRICGKKFSSKFVLEQHKFIHRQKIETKTLSCQISNCTYIEQQSNVAKSHDNDVIKLYACTYSNCDFHGETMEQLKIHSRKHSQEPEFRFYCEHCDYKTKISSHLKRHMRIHEANRGRIYKCNFCDYACNNSENLRKHVLHSAKHQGRFMYECSECDDENLQFKCNYLKDYQQHLESAHNIMKTTKTKKK